MHTLYFPLQPQEQCPGSEMRKVEENLKYLQIFDHTPFIFLTVFLFVFLWKKELVSMFHITEMNRFVRTEQNAVLCFYRVRVSTTTKPQLA